MENPINKKTMKDVNDMIYRLNELQTELDRQARIGFNVSEAQTARDDMLKFFMDLKSEYAEPGKIS